MPVLPLGELGGRLGRRTKGGRKNYQRGVQNVPIITKEGCRTYQNWPKSGANLMNEEVLKEKKGDKFLWGKISHGKLKKNFTRCHISMAGGANEQFRLGRETVLHRPWWHFSIAQHILRDKHQNLIRFRHPIASSVVLSGWSALQIINHNAWWLLSCHLLIADIGWV